MYPISSQGFRGKGWVGGVSLVRVTTRVDRPSRVFVYLVKCRSRDYLGILGRCDAKLQREHAEGLAALWFSQHPGLGSMLEAVRIHREAVQDTCPPAQMYSERSWLSWEQDV